MAYMGGWSGDFNGNWFGASDLPIGFISAHLAGVGALTGTASAVVELLSGDWIIRARRRGRR